MISIAEVVKDCRPQIIVSYLMSLGANLDCLVLFSNLEGHLHECALSTRFGNLNVNPSTISAQQ